MIKRVLCLDTKLAHACCDITNPFGFANNLVDWLAVKYQIESGSAVMFVDEQSSGALNGFLVGDVGPSQAQIDALFVDKNFHRCGVGTALLNAYEDYMHSCGVGEIKLVPRWTDSVRKFYAKCGYKRIGMDWYLQKSL